MLDTVIRGGMVVDGTGQACYRADVGIAGGRIETVGDLQAAEAEEVLDAQGLCVSPGFIDVHSHSDLALMEDPRGQSKIRQGVTTELVGQCGFSPFPLCGRMPTLDVSRMQTTYRAKVTDVDWCDLAGYAERINRQGCAINIAPLVGHATVRTAVMGYEDRPPTEEELEEMRRLVAEAMEQGAFGLSTGLTLVPSSYADTDEVIALAKVAARYGGIYDTHGRFWAGAQFHAAEEAIHIGRRSGARVQIAHLAIIDPRYQGQAERLAMILEQAAADEIDVTFDVYPYVAAGSALSQMLPGWVQEGGTAKLVERLRDPATRRRIYDELDQGWFRGIPWAWETFFVASAGEKGDPSWVGKHVQQLADEWNVHPKEAFLRLIDVSEDGIAAVMFNRTEQDMQYFLRHPLSMVGSDGNAIAADGWVAGAKVHPRFYGTFPRVLGRYVRDLGVLPLESAVHKMTGAPAARLGLRDRGRIAPGYVADLTLFDPKTVADRATFEEPHQYPLGVPHVMVKGRWVLRDGEHTGALPAGVLSRST